MIVKNSLRIDLARPSILPVLSAVQGDTYTRKVDIALYSFGAPVELPRECEIVVRYGKPDGTTGIYTTLPDGSVAWAISDNVVTITLCPQMLTCPGKVSTQVSIVNGDEVISTFTFWLYVEADPSKGSAKSEPYNDWRSAFLPQTTGAKVGQYVTVTKVDSEGHVLAVSTTNEPNETNQLATNAKNTAETANSKAEQATTLANKAQSTANSALEKANAALPADSLPDVINDALAQAKESGEFDGEGGKNGSNGLSILAVNITAGNAQKIVVSADNVIENGYMLSPRDILVGDKVLTEDGKIFIVDSWNFSVDTSGGSSMAYNATFFADAGSGIKSVNGVIPDENGNVEVEIPEGSSGVYVGSDEPTDPDIQIWINPEEAVPDVNYVKSVNGITPDENGNVEITIPEGSVGTNVTLDPTLTQSGAAADAKAVGDALAELEKKIPEQPVGKGLGITGAAVGQTIKIAAVDDNGVPTAWEPVNESPLRLITSLTLEENSEGIEITGLNIDKPFTLLLYKPGDACKSGWDTAVNGKTKWGYTGTITRTLTGRPGLIQWFYEKDSMLTSHAYLASGEGLFYTWEHTWPVNKLYVKPHYADGSEVYISAGAILELWEGLYPNVI